MSAVAGCAISHARPSANAPSTGPTTHATDARTGGPRAGTTGGTRRGASACSTVLMEPGADENAVATV